MTDPLRASVTVGQSSVDVIVVGAGVAGLTTASVLHSAGIEVVCLEARDRVGGRTLSAGWVDLGATWFWDGEAAISETVASLHLEPYPQMTSGDALFEQPDAVPVRLAGNPIDVPAWRLGTGMQSVALALAGRLPERVVRTGERVDTVAFDAEDSVQVGTSDGLVVGRMLVLAVPPRLAVETIRFSPGLPPELVRVAAEVHT